MKKVFEYKKNRPWARDLNIIMQLGLTMAGCIVFCFYVGYQLGQIYGAKGVFITVFTLLGVAGGANVCYRQIMEITRDSGEGHDGGNPPGGSENGRG